MSPSDFEKVAPAMSTDCEQSSPRGTVTQQWLVAESCMGAARHSFPSVALGCLCIFNMSLPLRRLTEALACNRHMVAQPAAPADQEQGLLSSGAPGCLSWHLVRPPGRPACSCCSLGAFRHPWLSHVPHCVELIDHQGCVSLAWAAQSNPLKLRHTQPSSLRMSR